jgi:hypothetical protein
MSEWMYADDAEKLYAERDQFADGMMKALGKADDIKADRDEWKTQHENLLAMYRTQSDQLAAMRSALQRIRTLSTYSISQGILIDPYPDQLLKAVDVYRIIDEILPRKS